MSLAARHRSNTTKDPNGLEDDQSISMHDVVTSRKDEPEDIEDDVTTNRDGLNDTYAERDNYKSAERIKGGTGLQSYMRSAGAGRKDFAKAGTMKNIA